MPESAKLLIWLDCSILQQQQQKQKKTDSIVQRGISKDARILPATNTRHTHFSIIAFFMISYLEQRAWWFFYYEHDISILIFWIMSLISLLPHLDSTLLITSSSTLSYSTSPVFVYSTDVHNITPNFKVMNLFFCKERGALGLQRLVLPVTALCN